MAYRQFHHVGGDVLVTGGLVVDEENATALMAVFMDEHTAAMKAGRVDMAVAIARTMAELNNAFFERALWRRAASPFQPAAGDGRQPLEN